MRHRHCACADGLPGFDYEVPAGADELSAEGYSLSGCYDRMSPDVDCLPSEANGLPSRDHTMRFGDGAGTDGLPGANDALPAG